MAHKKKTHMKEKMKKEHHKEESKHGAKAIKEKEAHLMKKGCK